MQLQNKNRIAYLGALTLLFSYAEMLLPRFVPFFRLGLGNIAILLAFDLQFPSFLLLTIIKSVTASMMAGTLFSPFFLISIAQSVFSGVVMYGVYKVNEKSKRKISRGLISIYGVSMIGSAVSAVIQLFLSSLYLGSETLALAAPMLFFSVAAAIVTAFFSRILMISSIPPTIKEGGVEKENTENQHKKKRDEKLSLLLVVIILVTAIACFMINNIYILVGAFVISLVCQKFAKRRILIMPHLSIWLFVIIISVLTPSGKVLWKCGKFSLTQGALLLGIIKSLKLSIAAALSQCAASLKPSSNTLIGLTLLYYRSLLNNFSQQEGKFVKRLQSTLSAVEL